MVAQSLIGGVINGVILCLIAFLLSRFAGDIYGRALLVIFLFIALGAYVGFAVSALVSGLWVLAQVAHVIVLGSMGLLGLHGSPYWLAAAWPYMSFGTTRSTTSDQDMHSLPVSGLSPV